MQLNTVCQRQASQMDEGYLPIDPALGAALDHISKDSSQHCQHAAAWSLIIASYPKVTRETLGLKKASNAGQTSEWPIAEAHNRGIGKPAPNIWRSLPILDALANCLVQSPVCILP